MYVILNIHIHLYMYLFIRMFDDKNWRGMRELDFKIIQWDWVGFSLKWALK